MITIKRPILIAVIGYLIGILMGLYFKFSIVLFYIPITAIYLINKNKIKKTKKKFKLISFKRYYRYIKIIIKPKVIFLAIIFSIISNSIILYQNSNYNNLYKENQKYNLIAIVVSNKIEKDYNNLYVIKVLNTKNNIKKFKSTKLYLKLNKNQELEYGEKILLTGTFEFPNKASNYKGFDYSNYLKTLKIYGFFNQEKMQIIEKQSLNPFLIYTNKISVKIGENIDKIMPKESASIVKGLILGDTSKIEEDIQEKFRTANISHILAISGMHISYIIIGIDLISRKIFGKRKTKFITIIFLICYMFITGFSPSIVRASIMAIILISSGIFYTKKDTITSISLSMLILLIYNPYIILSLGFQFSYLGTIGIIVFRSNILKILNNICKIHNNIIDKIKEIIAVTTSAQIMILPVMIYHFNTIGIYTLITNVCISIIIGPIIIFSFIAISMSFINIKIAKMLAKILNIGIKLLLQISEISKLPLSKIYVATPKIYMVVIYMLIAILLNFIYSIYKKPHLNNTSKRIKNLIALLKFKIIENRVKLKKIIYKLLVIIFAIIIINKSFLHKLQIYFVDVGQGDCTFIVANNKTILIDGGGSSVKNFDVGKNTLLPYILDRGYTKIDYIFISHFDDDHVLRNFIFIK